MMMMFGGAGCAAWVCRLSPARPHITATAIIQHRSTHRPRVLMSSPRTPSGPPTDSLRERIRTQLELHDLARRPLAGFHVERRACADGRPQSLPFPSALRVVDAAVHPLRVVPGRIRHAEDDEFAVLQ